MNDQSLSKTILILSANPRGTDQLRLANEVREIQECIQRSRYRERFVIHHQPAARPRDVQRAMLDCNPHIVHFCGHGTGDQGLILEDETGNAKVVSTTALATLFELFADRVDCVLLNACYSEVQARAISNHINSVIGMNQAIGDGAAIEFSRSFYDALGSGKPVEFAFRLGKNAMQLEGIAEDHIPVLIPKPQTAPNPVASSTRSRIFISYKRGVSPDESVALDVFRALSDQHDVFIDQTMLVGTPWAERLGVELHQSDFLITFLTQNSVTSEMVKGEIEMAHRLSKEQGRPTILPVRLAYREPFTYPLSTYLNDIHWAFWESPADTSRLIQDLSQAIAGNRLSIDTEHLKTELLQPPPAVALPRPLPQAQPTQAQAIQPSALEMPEGTMDAESQFYVARISDEIALKAIERQGVTITIKGPRQMGKSSLLIQVVNAVLKVDKRVVFLDFQLLDSTTLAQSDTFFRHFCELVTTQLELPDRVEEYWQAQSGHSQRCTRYMQNYILKELGNPLLLAMDEVDRVFETSFQSDFFSMLRGWHNNRALPTTRIWRNLDLALVTATEPYHLIENLNQSPFNVGEVISLENFTLEQVADLNRRHGSPFNLAQEQQLMDWVNGHPYLVRRALYLVASQHCTVDTLFSQATADRGPFGDHLRYHLFRISDRPDLVAGLRQVIQHQTCSDARVLRLLTAAGLVSQHNQKIIPRCHLYAEFFRERLHG